MDTWLEVLQAEVRLPVRCPWWPTNSVCPTTISQKVCNRSIQAIWRGCRGWWKGNLMGHKVTCPILGRSRCISAWPISAERADEVGTRPMDIKLWKACHSGCPIASSVRISNCAGRCVSPPNRFSRGGRQGRRYDAEATLSRLRRQAKAMARTPATACAFWLSCWPKSSRSWASNTTGCSTRLKSTGQ